MSPATAEDHPFRRRDWLLFLAMSLVWGSSFLLIDIGLDALPPGVITFIRVGSGAATLALLRRPARRIDPADRVQFVVLSIIWVALPFTFFPLAEQHINSSITGLLNGATPIFAAVIGALAFGRRASGAVLVGIVVGFVGIVLISLPSLDEGASEAIGVALVLAATACYGVALNLTPPLQAKYRSLTVMTYMLALATIWTLPFALIELGEAHWEVGPVLAVLVLGIVGTGLAFAMMGELVASVGPTRASFITYLIPGVALILGVVFRGDEVGTLALFGIVLVVIGAILAGRAGGRPAWRRQPR